MVVPSSEPPARFLLVRFLVSCFSCWGPGGGGCWLVDGGQPACCQATFKQRHRDQLRAAHPSLQMVWVQADEDRPRRDPSVFPCCFFTRNLSQGFILPRGRNQMEGSVSTPFFVVRVEETAVPWAARLFFLRNSDAGKMSFFLVSLWTTKKG